MRNIVSAISSSTGCIAHKINRVFPVSNRIRSRRKFGNRAFTTYRTTRGAFLPFPKLTISPASMHARPDYPPTRVSRRSTNSSFIKFNSFTLVNKHNATTAKTKFSRCLEFIVCGRRSKLFNTRFDDRNQLVVNQHIRSHRCSDLDAGLADTQHPFRSHHSKSTGVACFRTEATESKTTEKLS